jgi:hypothetical protein
MNTRRIVFSVLLLVVYALGYSHSVLAFSHQHSKEGVFTVGSAHHHPHYEHAIGEIVDHEHVEHQGHLDDGLLDFLMCILAESESSTSDVSECSFLTSKSIIEFTDVFANAHLANIQLNYLHSFYIQQYSIRIVVDASGASLLSPFTSDPNRGPPSTSFC